MRSGDNNGPKLTPDKSMITFWKESVNPVEGRFNANEDQKLYGFYTKTELSVLFIRLYEVFATHNVQTLGFKEVSDEAELELDGEEWRMTYTVLTPFDKDNDSEVLFKVIVEAKEVTEGKMHYIGIDTDIDESSDHMPAFHTFARDLVKKPRNEAEAGPLFMFKDELNMDDEEEESEEEDEDDE